MRAEVYLLLKNWLISLGYADEIHWAENITECQSAEDFAREYAFVVANSGMRAATATLIFKRVMQALDEGRPLGEVFRHQRKCAAIQYVHDHKEELITKYQALSDATAKLAFLETLPQIGPIVKYHLAKNFGLPVCKPDRHLARIAAFYQTTPDELCAALSQATRDQVPTIDTVIWRAASLQLITFKNDVPLIPSWPSSRDAVDILCPYCWQPQTLNVKPLREKGCDWHLCDCPACGHEFFSEPGVESVKVAKLYGPEQAEDEPVQLSLLDQSASSN